MHEVIVYSSDGHLVDQYQGFPPRESETYQVSGLRTLVRDVHWEASEHAPTVSVTLASPLEQFEDTST